MSREGKSDDDASQDSGEEEKIKNWKLGERYICTEIIGKGAFAKVASAYDRVRKCNVAIKRFPSVNVEDSYSLVCRIYREIRILRHLYHPYIVSLIDVRCQAVEEAASNLEEDHASSPKSQAQGRQPSPVPHHNFPVPTNFGKVYLVLECMDADLAQIIGSRQFLNFDQVLYIMFQLLEAVRFLHEQDVVHRDLKPSNILVNCSDCSLKLGDFGLAKVVDNQKLMNEAVLYNNGKRIVMSEPKPISSGVKSSLPRNGESKSDLSLALPSDNVAEDTTPLTAHVTTRWYRSPEVILMQPYIQAIDMWGIGCVMAEVLQCIKGNLRDHKKRKPLFPGERYGALSSSNEEDQLHFHDEEGEGDDQPKALDRPATKKKKGWLKKIFSGLTSSSIAPSKTVQVDSNEFEPTISYNTISENSKGQLQLIFDFIGTPDIDELDHLDESTRRLLLRMERKPRKDFAKIFPACTSECLDLLFFLLQFNPMRRITAEEALNHTYIEDIYMNKHLKNQIIGKDWNDKILREGSKHVTPLSPRREQVKEDKNHLDHSLAMEILSFS